MKAAEQEPLDKAKSGSRIMLDVGRDRRDLIRQKYNKRISEEQYLRL